MRWGRALVVALAALAFACGGLPDPLVEDAERLDQRIEAIGQDVSREESELAAMLERAEHAVLAPYAERENWKRYFAEARAELADARSVFDGKVASLLEQDEEETASDLARLLSGIQEDVRRAKTLAGEAGRRAEYLAQVNERGPTLVEEARAALEAVEPARVEVAGKAAKASADYPAKQEDLQGRLAGIAEAQRSAGEALAVADAELPGLSSGAADLAVLGDAVTEAEAQAALAQAGIADVSTRVGELYRSYSKTLIDMRERYVAVIGRTSWNEAIDFPAEHEYKFRREIDEQTAAVLAEWGDKTLATGVNTTFITPAVWNALAINRNERLPRGDNAAEFWLDDIETTFYHRYLLVEGDAKQESEWVEVSEDFYEQHFEDLGMDVVAKPYGMYEDEVLTHAAPAGMAYVGDPRYGSWENDASGRRYWSWGDNFLFYYLLFGRGGRHYYYYDDWNRWRGGYRGSRPWYGESTAGGARRYGTAGSVTAGSSRYAGSTFGRSGGFTRQDRTFRGAGPGGRGGGSGSRGK